MKRLSRSGKDLAVGTGHGIVKDCIWNVRPYKAQINSMRMDRTDSLTVKAMCKEGRYIEVLHILGSVNQQNFELFFDISACILQCCITMEDLARGKLVHVQVIRGRLKPNIFLNNTLINMYAKCGSIIDALKVFEIITLANVFTWTSLITAYAHNGDGRKALELFHQMKQEGVMPTRVTFVSTLNACAISNAFLEYGKHMHADILRAGCESDIFVSSTLIDMYAKCGIMECAQQVFDRMLTWNIVSWNAIIAGYANNDDGHEALVLFKQMCQHGIKANEFTYVGVLCACIRLLAYAQGKWMHANILQSGFNLHTFIGNSLIDMYAKCWDIEFAQNLFERMPLWNTISWNTIIAGYAHSGNFIKTIELFGRMQQACLTFDAFSFVSVLSVCRNVGILEHGKRVHAYTVKACQELDTNVSRTLLDMYVKCGSVDDAFHVFQRMPSRNTFTWTSMISTFLQQGKGTVAMKLFEQMQVEHVEADQITYLSILSIYNGNTSSIGLGKFVHSSILKVGYGSDMLISSTLVDMYAKCGSIGDACQVFGKISSQNVVSWSAMIGGHIQHGNCIEAIKLFRQMQEEGIKPNQVTFISILNACMGVSHGKWIHAKSLEAGYASIGSIDNSLIDMYAKCGSLNDARRVFENVQKRDVALWNAMIAGSTQHGEPREPFGLFNEMLQEGFRPDDITWISILSACSHSCLLDRGCHFFHAMSQDYRITPAVDHYACMVDILAHVGCLYEARDLIEAMPLEPDAVVWMSLLAASRVYNNVEAGEHSLLCVVKLKM